MRRLSGENLSKSALTKKLMGITASALLFTACDGQVSSSPSESKAIISEAQTNTALITGMPTPPPEDFSDIFFNPPTRTPEPLPPIVPEHLTMDQYLVRQNNEIVSIKTLLEDSVNVSDPNILVLRLNDISDANLRLLVLTTKLGYLSLIEQFGMDAYNVTFSPKDDVYNLYQGEAKLGEIAEGFAAMLEKCSEYLMSEYWQNSRPPENHLRDINRFINSSSSFFVLLEIYDAPEVIRAKQALSHFSFSP